MRYRRVWAIAALTVAIPLLGGYPAAARSTTYPEAGETGQSLRADFGSEAASVEARQVANWVASSHDNRGMPFVIVDKVNAKVFVFDRMARIRGTSRALLGLAVGDDSVPGIGERKFSAIRPHERTTPAGRFVAERGRNHTGEKIVWVDYHAAVSIHRVRPGHPAEKRAHRLASPTAADKRISEGCINVPVRFFQSVVAPTFSRSKGIVYVLPEVRSVQEVFGLHKVSSSSTIR